MVGRKSDKKNSIGKKSLLALTAGTMLAGLGGHAKAHPSMEDKVNAAHDQMKAMSNMSLQMNKAGMEASKALSAGLAQLMSGSKIQLTNILGTLKTVTAKSKGSKPGPMLHAMNDQINAFFG